MTERPILFSGPMVKAILDGRKTQTRRIVKPQPASHQGKIEWSDHNPGWWIVQGDVSNTWSRVRCPYGTPGDRLWVKEKFGISANGYFYSEHADGTVKVAWKSGRFMPRVASRLTLEITDIRVQRLQEISGKDILTGGAVARAHDDQFGHNPVSAFDGKVYLDLISLWRAGWDSINRKRAPWASNPWVWALSFKRVEP
jgi:hypothetical protein